MKKRKSGFLILLDGVVIGVIVGLVMPFEWRAKLSQRILERVAPLLDYMPDG